MCILCKHMYFVYCSIRWNETDFPSYQSKTAHVLQLGGALSGLHDRIICIHYYCLLCISMLLFLKQIGAVAYTGPHYGSGMGPVYLNELGCTGVESNLTDCSHSVFGVVSSACRTHLNDASVFCPTGKYCSIMPTICIALKHT